MKIQWLNKTSGNNYQTKILKKKRKVQSNNHNNYNNKNIITIIEKKMLKLFHFDNYPMIMTLLPRKLVLQIFQFPKYILHTRIKN